MDIKKIYCICLHCSNYILYAGVISGTVSIVQRPNRPDVCVYLQPVENSNRGKMRDEFLHGLVAAGCLCTVTCWPFCLPNLSVMQLCPAVACCLAPIIYSWNSCNLSIQFSRGHCWGIVENTRLNKPKLDDNKHLRIFALWNADWFRTYLPPVLIGVISQ